MSYNYWKLMDKVDVAVRTGEKSFRGFTGYVVEHGDKKGLERATDWARTQTWDREKREHVATNEPEIHTFKNEGFKVTIDSSAGSSSQSGKLSFWGVYVEKDGIKFKTQVASDILVELIKNVTIINGEIQEELMFARRAGTQGFLHKGMELYKEALEDDKHKKEMKSAKKTSKWQIGGVYQTITITDICIGDVWDTMEEVSTGENRWPYRNEKKLVLRDRPVKVKAWIHISRYDGNDKIPETLEEALKNELDSSYPHCYAGKAPARAKTKQLKFKASDLKLVDKMLAMKEEYVSYNEPKVKNRYKRVL